VVFAVFFFQAEDGIRDATVTGVQTCALPICQKKMASNWQATAFMRSALALGDTSSWKISSTQVVAGGLFVDDAVLHHMHEVAQRLHRAQRVAIHHNDVRSLPGSNRAQVVALQQLR